MRVKLGIPQASKPALAESLATLIRKEFVEFSVRDGGYLNVEIAACGVPSDSDVILVLHRECSTE